ncbi:hypothetical protein DVH24_033040 [Malus domestica]|uniref:Uncharacterized protein n=1 Tax=Malus domestica TaxID=3750 RepID=A0A498IN17_MALDO|nr:hypothetical protein DVH24_033040 [Malus domestica]
MGDSQRKVWGPVVNGTRESQELNPTSSHTSLRRGLHISLLLCCTGHLDCRMDRMKSNYRKAAMETRQQHIQVDLGNLMAFDPHHSFPSIPFSKEELVKECITKGTELASPALAPWKRHFSLLQNLIGFINVLTFVGILNPGKKYKVEEYYKQQEGLLEGFRFGFSTGSLQTLLSIRTRGSNNLADVAGVDEAKAELEEIVEFLRNPDKYIRLGARPPRGVLLVECIIPKDNGSHLEKYYLSTQA